MTKVKDPICGMSVDTATARFQVTQGAETVYFCSEMCRRTYESRHAPK